MVIKKKKSSTGLTAREKMLARKKKLADRSNGSGFVFPKEGTTRVRIKSPGEDQELGMEVVHFYLSAELGGIISPATFDEPCPFMEKYLELKSSKDPSDKELAKLLIPKRKYVIGGIVFEDEKGTKPAYDGQNKVVQITSSIYQDIIDLYLDEDEGGDMTDPDTGYDIKIVRTGTGKLDTTYSVRQCKPTKLPKNLNSPLDLEKMVRDYIKSYDELEDLLNQFLNTEVDEGDDEEISVKKKFAKKVKKIKKRGLSI